MKAKLIIGGIALIAGLYFINRSLNEQPKYMEDTPSTSTPASGAVRQEMIVGFLPVT
ncbi:MAG: hypothetical protein RL277_1190 [Planctomycetota bacterium]|jgi:hypothetical protein